MFVSFKAARAKCLNSFVLCSKIKYSDVVIYIHNIMANNMENNMLGIERTNSISTFLLCTVSKQHNIILSAVVLIFYIYLHCICERGNISLIASHELDSFSRISNT